MFIYLMMSTGYQIDDQSGCYYLTFQIVDWIDIFSRQVYRDIILDSWKYCISNKSLRLHAYVIMSNHIHLIASSRDGNLSDIIRDFKRHTTRQMLTEIRTETESRRDWLLTLFAKAANAHERNEKFQVWTHENHAVALFSNKFYKQKLNYIHENPVRAGIVAKEEDYIYSSAGDYCIGKIGLIELELLVIT